MSNDEYNKNIVIGILCIIIAFFAIEFFTFMEEKRFGRFMYDSNFLPNIDCTFLTNKKIIIYKCTESGRLEEYDELNLPSGSYIFRTIK